MLGLCASFDSVESQNLGQVAGCNHSIHCGLKQVVPLDQDEWKCLSQHSAHQVCLSVRLKDCVNRLVASLRGWGRWGRVYAPVSAKQCSLLRTRVCCNATRCSIVSVYMVGWPNLYAALLDANSVVLACSSAARRWLHFSMYHHYGHATHKLA